MANEQRQPPVAASALCYIARVPTNLTWNKR